MKKLLLIALVLMAATGAAQAIFIPHKIRVNMTNNIGTDLTVHCKSGDDDLGIQQLGIKGHFSFVFRPNFFDTTLFYCSFKWQESGKWIVKWFDIFVGTRDGTCDYSFYCDWMINRNAPCRWNPDKLIYDWCLPYSK